jgi:hypothetical protein
MPDIKSVEASNVTSPCFNLMTGPMPQIAKCIWFHDLKPYGRTTALCSHSDGPKSILLCKTERYKLYASFIYRSYQDGHQ